MPFTAFFNKNSPFNAYVIREVFGSNIMFLIAHEFKL